MHKQQKLKITHVPISELRPFPGNPRKWNAAAAEQLKRSILDYSIVDPLIVNSAPSRKNIVIGGNFRLSVLKDMKMKEVPVVYINISDLEKEKELNIR